MNDMLYHVLERCIRTRNTKNLKAQYIMSEQ